MFAKVKGKVIEYEGFIPVKATVKLRFFEKVRVLFGDTLAFYVHVYTKEPVTIVHMDSRAGVGPEHKPGAVKKTMPTVKKMVPIILAFLLFSCKPVEFGHTRRGDRQEVKENRSYRKDYLLNGNRHSPKIWF